jgi:branched-chain amino acid transport system substrate-binding protein
MPYSGPASSYAPIGKVEVAYIDMINPQGGINGRKIKLLSLDDGNSPRENIMRQAANLDMQLPMFQAGIRYRTTATDYLGIKRLRLQRFDGKAWVPFGEPISA